MDYVQVIIWVQVLSWDTMLNMTNVKLELVSDPYMHIFFEKCMSGGVSYISNRYSKDNIKYLRSFDPKQDTNHK